MQLCTGSRVPLLLPPKQETKIKPIPDGIRWGEGELEQWLMGKIIYCCCLRDRCLSPLLGSSKPPVTPATRRSVSFGLCGHCTHLYIPTHGHIHLIKNKGWGDRSELKSTGHIRQLTFSSGPIRETLGFHGYPHTYTLF